MDNQSNTAVAEKVSVEVNLAGACLEAVGEVLKVTAGSEVVCRDDKSPDSPTEARGYQGKINLSGDLLGEVIVAVPHSLAALLAARFVGCDPSELDGGSVGEGVGEIANQISGRVATLLSREGCNVRISTPEIALSSQWHLPPSDAHTIFRFDCIKLPFLLIVSAARGKANSESAEQ